MPRKRTIAIIATALLLLFIGSLCVFDSLVNARGKASGLQLFGNKGVRASNLEAAQQSAHPLSGGDGYSRVELLSCTPGETTLRFHLGEVTVGDVIVDGKAYTIVEAKGCAMASRAGEPELPVFRFDVAADADVVCVVDGCDWDETEAPPPRPSAGAYWRSFGFEGERKEDRGIYAHGGMYPAEVASIQSTYRLRGVSGAGVLLRPVCYDFGRGVLRTAKSMDVRVLDGVRGNAQALDGNASFANLQSGLFVNSEVLAVETTALAANPVGTLLLVMPDAWSGAERGFVSWKRNVGFDVNVCHYPSETGEEADALAAVIRSAYDSSGITHVILCGDCDDVPPAYTSKNTQRPGTKKPTSDAIYAFLSGDDYMADVFISRVPAHSAEQLEYVLEKLVSYEANPPDDDSWRDKMLVMCSTECSSSGIYKGISDFKLLKAEYDGLASAGVFQYDESRLLCDDTSTSDNVSAVLNGDGAPLFYYLGHGKYDAFYISGKKRFTVSDAVELQNGMRLPLILAPVCDSGNFANSAGDCLAEAFFLNGQFAENGASAVVAATSETLWNPPIKCISEFSLQLTKVYSPERCLSSGELFLKSLIAGIRLADSEGSSIVDSPGRYFASQMHLFGDCTMMPRLRALRPAKVETSLNEEGTLQVSVKWSDDGTPVKGAYVSVSPDGQDVYRRTMTDANGHAIINECRFNSVATIRVNDSSMRQYSSRISVDGNCRPDADGDGKVSNNELLSFLNHAADCADCQAELDAAVELWKNNGIVPPTAEESLPSGKFCEVVDNDFNSYGNVMSEMESMATDFCDLCRLEFVGQTSEGREIRGLCICTADEAELPHLLVVAGTGDDESNSPQIALRIARLLLKNKELSSMAAFHVVPILNPDKWEGAAASVAASEAALRWIACGGFAAAVVISSGGGIVATPSNTLFDSELFALRQVWACNSELFPNLQEGAVASSLANLMMKADILGLDVNVGLSNKLEEKELQSLCEECESPFAKWCKVATTGVSVSLADEFPLSDAGLPCNVSIDGRKCGVDDGCGNIVWLSKRHRWFRTLVKGEHDIDVSADGTYTASRHFAVSDDFADLKVSLPLVDGSPLQGIAISPRRFVPGQEHLLESEYKCPNNGAVIWNLYIPKGWTVVADSSYASRTEADGSASLLFLNAPAQGRLQCGIRVAYSDAKGEVSAVSSLLWHNSSSVVRFFWHPQAQRTVAVSLKMGWTLLGSTMTAHVPNELKAWMFDGKFHEAVSFFPGHAFWLYSEKDVSYNITGWESDSYINYAKSGWRLFTPMRHTRANEKCYEFSRESRCYRRTDDVLKPGKAYWIFGE